MWGGWEQQDAVGEVIDRLEKVVPNPDQVVEVLPEKWNPRSSPPMVVVQSDGTPVTSKGWTRETVRIRVQARTLPQAMKAMRQLDSFLLTPGLVLLGLSILPGAGIIGGSDSLLGGFYSSATYRVAMPRKAVW